MFRGFPVTELLSKEGRQQLRALHRRKKCQPVTTPWGFKFLGPEFLSSGHFQAEETQLIRKLLENVDVLVNVGAHVGYYCCHALQMGKRVIAVEPNFDNAHYLLRNIHLNGWSGNAEVFLAAVGSGPDTFEMWGSGTAASLIRGWGGNGPLSTLVPILTVDRVAADVVAGQRALFIMDVEGYEFFALQGATRCLESKPCPVWMVEIAKTRHRPSAHSENSHLLETFDYFFDRGYSCATAKLDAEVIDRPRVQSSLHENAPALPTTNFLFS